MPSRSPGSEDMEWELQITGAISIYEWNRKKVWKMGDQSFDNLINSRLHVALQKHTQDL
jgi:hypothetical protein